MNSTLVLYYLKQIGVFANELTLTNYIMLIYGTELIPTLHTETHLICGLVVLVKEA